MPFNKDLFCELRHTFAHAIDYESEDAPESYLNYEYPTVAPSDESKLSIGATTVQTLLDKDVRIISHEKVEYTPSIYLLKDTHSNTVSSCPETNDEYCDEYSQLMLYHGRIGVLKMLLMAAEDKCKNQDISMSQNEELETIRSINDAILPALISVRSLEGCITSLQEIEIMLLYLQEQCKIAITSNLSLVGMLEAFYQFVLR